ncbi:DUF952 domain-containing protein [Demequina globuliformis]|uniref:DUF952 domain-containing protein n=1 Tax=Demequina globuliformis TaxID=676202 RepID=UPI0007806CE7|nr:DUF952 domain-containing protein [Demequina globuliformis]
MAIYHLALVRDWEAAVAAGEYRVSTLGRSFDEVGFIHAGHAHQVAGVAEAFYAGVTEPLCVLTVDVETALASGAELIEEDGGEGQLYPHIYAAIDPAWVTEVRPAGFERGRFVW